MSTSQVLPGRTARGWAWTAAALFALGLAPAGARAQQTFQACYVPAVGAMYLIGLPGLPTACLSANHQMISWTEGGDSIADGSVTEQKLAFDPATQAELDAHVAGDVSCSGCVGGGDLQNGGVSRAKLGSDVLLPLAYGLIDGTNCTLYAQSSNVVGCTHPSTGEYDITLNGESYNAVDYVTVATPLLPPADIGASAGSGGKLRLIVRDPSGPLIDTTIQFVTFKR